jgi:hypothetical protein
MSEGENCLENCGWKRLVETAACCLFKHVAMKNLVEKIAFEQALREQAVLPRGRALQPEGRTSANILR